MDINGVISSFAAHDVYGVLLMQAFAMSPNFMQYSIVPSETSVDAYCGPPHNSHRGLMSPPWLLHALMYRM